LFYHAYVHVNFQGLETTANYLIKSLKLIVTSINFSPSPSCNIASKVIRHLCHC